MLVEGKGGVDRGAFHGPPGEVWGRTGQTGETDLRPAPHPDRFRFDQSAERAGRAEGQVAGVDKVAFGLDPTILDLAQVALAVVDPRGQRRLLTCRPPRGGGAVPGRGRPSTRSCEQVWPNSAGRGGRLADQPDDGMVCTAIPPPSGPSGPELTNDRTGTFRIVRRLFPVTAIVPRKTRPAHGFPVSETAGNNTGALTLR